MAGRRLQVKCAGKGSCRRQRRIYCPAVAPLLPCRRTAAASPRLKHSCHFFLHRFVTIMNVWCCSCAGAAALTSRTLCSCSTATWYMRFCRRCFKRCTSASSFKSCTTRCHVTCSLLEQQATRMRHITPHLHLHACLSRRICCVLCIQHRYITRMHRSCWPPLPAPCCPITHLKLSPKFRFQKQSGVHLKLFLSVC